MAFLFFGPAIIGGFAAMLLPSLSRLPVAAVSIPFQEIPFELIRKCYDEQGRVADINQKWNTSNKIHPTLPRTRVKLACKLGSEWYLSCEFGAFSPPRSLQYTGYPLQNGEWVIEDSGINLQSCNPKK